jgi:signal peptidase I
MKSSWARTALSWGAAALAVFAFQTAAARRMYIPSESMMPTLLKGDELIVSKYPYGWSTASLAIHGNLHLPGRIFGRTPEYGDVVTVVRSGDGEDLIKRVIGLPGDTIQVSHGALILNGQRVPRVSLGLVALPLDTNQPCADPVIARFRAIDADGKPSCRVPVYRETLPNGVRYDTLDLGDHDLGNGYISPGDDYGPIRVPAGYVFLMGDNRDNSADSRFSLADGGLGGPVPIDSISGRAERITNSYDGSGSWLNPISWVTTLRRDRSWTNLRPARSTEAR